MFAGNAFLAIHLGVIAHLAMAIYQWWVYCTACSAAPVKKKENESSEAALNKT